MFSAVTTTARRNDIKSQEILLARGHLKDETIKISVIIIYLPIEKKELPIYQKVGTEKERNTVATKAVRSIVEQGRTNSASLCMTIDIFEIDDKL